MKTLQTDTGFTLIEALIAMVILSIGIFSLYSMQMNAIKGNSKASFITTASVRTADLVESIISVSPEDINTDTLTLDSNADGILDKPIIDANENGELGLDNVTPATADDYFVFPDGRFTVYWNVAADVPMPQVTTIRVHVVDNHRVLSIPVTFTYLKNDVM